MSDTLKCTVRTPQFKDGIVHEWKVQEGELDMQTFLFTPDDKIGGHRVEFHSLEEFNKFKIECSQ